MSQTPTPLPIDEHLPQIAALLSEHGVLVVQAAPGAGKTTRVPASILASHDREIWVLEPRRLAAQLSAVRVADQMGVGLGKTVGYEVRGDSRVGRDTRLVYMTEGVFLRKIAMNPTLKGVGCIVLDEFHERHVTTDVSLSLASHLRATRRPDLKLIVMSATLESKAIADFLGAPVIESEGRMFPLEIEYLADDSLALASHVASGVRALIAAAPDGDILVFLPGIDAIRKSEDALTSLSRQHNFAVVALHGSMRLADQGKAVARGDRRKIVLATNVAESSITVENIAGVVDSGLAQIASDDPWTSMPVLSIAKVAKASLIQRAGRAGRLRAGRVIRLFSKADFDLRAAFTPPEISRLDLSDTLATLHAMELSFDSLRWLTPPPDLAIERAKSLLHSLGAIDANRLTKTGASMSRLPVHPRLGRLLVEAKGRRVAVSGATVAAILSTNRDLQNRDDRSQATDIEDLVTLVDQPDRTVNRASLTEVRELREQLLRQLDVSELDLGSQDDLRKSILTGFPERIGRVRADSGDVLLANGQQARIAAPGANLICALAVQTRRDGTHARANVSVYSTTDVESVMELFLEQLTESSEPTWDDARERVIVTNRIALGRLVIEESPSKTAINEGEVASLLFAKLKARGFANFVGEGFHETSLEQLQWRIALAKKIAAKECDAVRLGDLALETVIKDACRDRRSFAEIRELGLMNAVAEHVGQAAIAWLDRACPTTLTLKNGRKARITYGEHLAPSIASRLQDFFGHRETPSVLFGRVPLVVHLQAPNGRDVQVTTDLPGFWTNHYEKVRSELCRRYPRHAWPKPEDLP